MQTYRIGVLGDFSGLGGYPENERDPALDGFMTVDRDNWSEVFKTISPQIRLDLPFCKALKLTSPEQFSPTELVEAVPALSKLMEAKENLDNPPLMRRLIAESGAAAFVAPKEPKTIQTQSESDILDSILSGEAPEKIKVKPKPKSPDPVFNRLIQEIADASADRTDYAQQEKWENAIDQEIQDRVIKVLHHPRFQGMEALWLGLQKFLVKADHGDLVKVRILDCTRKELLNSINPLNNEDFDLLVTDFVIKGTKEDLELLKALGEKAMQAKTPIVAGADETLFDLGDSWEEIRNSACGDFLALAWPRILMRYPYGPDTMEVEGFEFSESGEDGYLWGNPAFGVAQALGMAFVSGSEPGQNAEIRDLPFHIVKKKGKKSQAGPMETLITESRVLKLVEKGIIPIAGQKGADSALIFSFKTISGASLFSDDA